MRISKAICGSPVTVSVYPYDVDILNGWCTRAGAKTLRWSKIGSTATGRAGSRTVSAPLEPRLPTSRTCRATRWSSAWAHERAAEVAAPAAVTASAA
jgi:hypothetical protein